MVAYVPHPPQITQPVAVEIRTVAQNASAVCPTGIPAIQPNEQKEKQERKQQAVDLMFKVGCVFEVTDRIEEKTDRGDGTTQLHLSLYNLIDIKFPNNPNEKISLDANPIIIKAIKTTLSQNVGPVVDGGQGRGLSQDILLTPKQWQTLRDSTDSFINNLKTELEDARKPKRSAALTLPEGLASEQLPYLLRFATALLNPQER